MEPDREIVKMISALRKDDFRVVTGVQEILDRLIDQKLAVRMRIPPCRVGVHPKNRNGYGCSAPVVHKLGARIVKMGWLRGSHSDAVCFQDGPDHKIAKFTHNLQNSTTGLGVVDQSEIDFGSVSSTHTNQFAVAAIKGVDSSEELLTLGGRMSVEKIGVDPQIKEILEQGLWWLVLKWPVDELYPDLADLIQHARNAPGAAHNKENEFQILLLIQTMVEGRAEGSQVDWKTIGDMIASRNDVDRSDIGVFLRFVQLYGGGDQGQFVRELERFHRVHVPAGRTVPSSTFSALVDLKFQPKEPAGMSTTIVVVVAASK